MDGSHHMATITELDLTACRHDSVVDRMNAVPGLKTSTAFFTFLRANLVLPPSAMSSNVNTPLLGPTSSQMLPPPSPSPLASQPATNLDDVPPLSLEVLTSRDDKADAMRLVADSIAQQRQTASLHLVFHPLNLTVLAAALATAYQLTRRHDAGLVMTVCSGVVMAYLMAIRYVTSPYLRVAEDLSWDWARSEDGDEDTIVGTRFGNDVVGALVLRLEQGQGPSPGAKKRGRGGAGAGLRGGRGVIRAWTTRLRYRRKGVGADMLHEAVRITRDRCGRDAEVGFAQEHANSRMVLPELFNGPFRKREMKAAKALEVVLGEWEGNRRKR